MEERKKEGKKERKKERKTETMKDGKKVSYIEKLVFEVCLCILWSMVSPQNTSHNFWITATTVYQ